MKEKNSSVNKNKSNRNKVRVIVTEHFSDKGKTLDELMSDVILTNIKKTAI